MPVAPILHEPFKPARPGRVVKKPPEGDLTIEPDEYELPDEDAAPFDVPASKKRKPLPKFKKCEPAEEALYNYPPIDLLSHGQAPDKNESDQSDLEKAGLLAETLRNFGIDTKLTGIAHGPAVTRFELQPAPGVKVSRITALSDDIALNLAAERVRIEAPIPGKAAVGVEIPNDKVETVALRDVLESADARRHASRVAVGLGKDNSGRYIVADIAKMPHVLIAGQTGSGKSVCINSIIVSILYRATPDEVKLILIDPKVVELSVYNGIPHLIAPVVTDPKKAASALDWAVAEMGTRYKRFAERGARDIRGYNKALEDGEKPMSQIVIIIDELADLMMIAPGEVEDSVCRLAQLARAAGMHLVIATQRPSVNVITGIIKANIPTRIAFSVASQVDSRTMIDHGGAEKLLGNGDMLFVPSGINKPMRVQGSWVSDQEVNAVTQYIKERHESTYDEDVVERINQSVMSDAEKEEMNDEYDPRLPEAVDIVLEAGQASISMLQRRMRVGYARAGRLIDEMALRGIVSEADGAKPRTVNISRDQFQQMFEEEEE
ncbi:MAG: DNA translocase FtsK [Clostridiales bacterium]|nr:DNA translocase FtsK [Clostridiales bacterium]